MSALPGGADGIRRDEGAHELRLDLPAAHSASRMARRMVLQFAISEGVPEAEVGTIEFVAGELLDNAVDHGGGGGSREVSDLDGDVRMNVYLGILDGRWLVRVDDQGGGKPEDVREFIDPRDDQPDLEDERGRCFYLLRHMVDDLAVDTSADGRGLAFRAWRTYERGG